MLCRQAEKNGGRVSTKSNPDGTESPYELNINYMELLREPGDSEEALIDKFILTQAVMLAMPGVPGIYFHSLFGSGNYEEGVRQTGRARSINREKLSYDKLLCELERKDSRRHKVFSEYSALLSVRKGLEYFNPGNKYEFPRISREIFAIKRYSENGDSFLLALNNLSAENIQLNAQKPGKNWTVRDVITGKTSNSEEITLRPFGVLWLL
jgi:sucrose phosphorylase